MTYQVTNADRKAIFDSAKRLGIDPYELGAVLNKESTFQPNVWGGDQGKYYGVIQFGDYERGEAGLDPKKVGNYTIAEQMPHVEKWLLGRGYKSGMGVGRLYNTVLAGNPDASMNKADSFGTTVSGSLESLMKGGKNYIRAQEVLGPSPTYDQTPTQTAAATTQNTSEVQEDPKTPGYSTRDFLMNFMRGQLQALKTNKNDLVDNYLKGAEANNISAQKAIEFFGGFD
jgi:hypothetical protein